MNTNPAPVGRLNGHDLKVIAFHIVIAAIQGGLYQAGMEHYGTYTPEVLMGIQILSEVVRRLIVV